MKERTSQRGYEIYFMKTTETYCVSCKKNTANKNSIVTKTKQVVLFVGRKKQGS